MSGERSDKREASVFLAQLVESLRDGRMGRTLEEPRPVADLGVSEVAVRWDDGEEEDCLSADLVFRGYV